MKSIKSRLVVALGLVACCTLAMALLLYIGDSRFEDNAGRTRQANDDVRELLDFALLAHRYMDVFGRSLGQRTLIANRERRVAASAFEDRINHIATTHHEGSAFHTLNWAELRQISSDLSGDLRVADSAREKGDFPLAEHLFAEARRKHFDQRMLPWFEAAIGTLRAEADGLEAEAIRSASQLRVAGSVLGALSVVIAGLAVLWISGSIISPVNALVAGAEAIGRGELSHRVRQDGAGEFALVTERFNHMAEALTSNQAALVEKNAQLEKAYRLQGEFVSVVSHELRSPLHSVIGYLEFIFEDEPTLSARTQKNLFAIDASAKRLLALVNDILDFSKLEARQMEASLSRFELFPLMQAVFEDGRALIQGRTIELVLDAPTEVFLESDELRLRQVLTNLLSNAIKFTDQGEVRLGARVAGERVEVSVRDTGIGIAQEQLGLIFKPFRQAKSAGARAASGTGLGLAIVARLAELIGGKVSVASELGVGTEFTISLPRVS
ncbi:MAG TPA: HAMP domain-containing sensor histidine kinase [Polyangiaceae bacterium]|jgi:signal transduction histidine kinase|nr:HAMP domain-containing sensor histidine kinase [Polyangiaceae bacterium]